VRDALTVRSHVRDARGQLAALDRGLRGGASLASQQQRLSKFAADVRSARSSTHGLVWSGLSDVPFFGRPLQSTRSLTAVVSDLSLNALPQLVRATDALEPLRAGATDGAIPLAPLEQAAPSLLVAERDLGQAQAQAAQVHGSWLGTVATARNQVLAQVTTLHADLGIAASAASLAPQMLGVDGPRTYLVAFLNPAEIRGGGGVIGGYALLRADAGRLSIVRIGTETQLPGLVNVPTGLNAEWLANYEPFDAATVWQNTDLSPDFPSTGAAWTAMYAADFGTHLDGVVGLDTNALATLLQFSGPVTVEGQTVTATNAVSFLETTEYTLPVANSARKDLLGEVGQAVFAKILGGHVSGQSLFTDISRDAGAGHVHLYAARSTEEDALGAYPVAGVLPVTDKPFFLATLTDAGGEKLSQYISEKVDYQVQFCGSTQRRVQVTITLRNDAPTTPLPPYVSTRLDDPPYAVARNQIRVLLSTLLTDGTGFGAATLNGTSIPLLAPGQESTGNAGGFQTSSNKGHPTLSTFLELPPGKTQTIIMTIGEPLSTARPILPIQALPQTPVVTYTPGACAA
jgi:hypothetical protein